MTFKVTDRIKQKLREKHRVELYEVEEALEDEGRVQRRISKNKKRQEAVYKFIGRTITGRLLQVYLVFKPGEIWLMSAYDGDKADRTLYNSKQ